MTCANPDDHSPLARKSMELDGDGRHRALDKTYECGDEITSVKEVQRGLDAHEGKKVDATLAHNTTNTVEMRLHVGMDSNKTAFTPVPDAKPGTPVGTFASGTSEVKSETLLRATVKETFDPIKAPVDDPHIDTARPVHTRQTASSRDRLDASMAPMSANDPTETIPIAIRVERWNEVLTGLAELNSLELSTNARVALSELTDKFKSILVRVPKGTVRYIPKKGEVGLLWPITTGQQGPGPETMMEREKRAERAYPPAPESGSARSLFDSAAQSNAYPGTSASFARPTLTDKQVD